MKIIEPNFDKLNSSSAKKTYLRVFIEYWLPNPLLAESSIKNSFLSSNTKNLYLNAISWIIKETKSKVPLPKLIRSQTLTDKMPLSNRQIDKVMWEYDFKNPQHREAFMLLIETGMRIEEIGLIKSINQEQGTFMVKGAKGNKDRFIPIPQKTDLVKYLKSYNGLNYQPFYRECLRIGKFLEQPLSPHTLRYTFATTRMYENGVPIEVISQIMGHSSINQTIKYIKFSFKNSIVHFKKQYLSDAEVIRNKDFEFQTEHYKKLYIETLNIVDNLKKEKNEKNK